MKSDQDRAWDWLTEHDSGTLHESALKLAAEFAAVRLETIAQCKAAHDAGIPWGSLEPSAVNSLESPNGSGRSEGKSDG